jgi:hypothetical protein
MARQSELSAFVQLKEIEGVFIGRTAHLCCTALRLADGKVCLFSPVQGLGVAAKTSLRDIGIVSHLIAPNHYHNKALAEYAAAFPKALLCTSSKAVPRLQKLTGLDFSDMGSVAENLAGGFTVLTPDGLKTGEIWLRCDAKRRRTWFVVDAFCGPKTSPESDRSETAAFLGTFPTYGVQDRTLYLSWLRQQLRADKPTLMVPCHGSIVASHDLPGQLLALAEHHL